MQETMSENASENFEEIGEVVTPEEAVIETIEDIESSEEPEVEVVQDGNPEEGLEEAPVKRKELDYSYTQNRELSWLQFDRRVLEEALDPSVPLFERLKFISIFCTNLDEFFMVRVGSLMDLSIIAPDIRENKTNMTPREQLEAVFAAVRPLVEERDEIYAQVVADLEPYGFKELDLDNLSKKERRFARDYYREYIRPVLSPQVVDERHPFPHLRNKELYIVTLLSEEDGSQHLGIVPVPENIAPIICDPEEPLHFVRAEKLIAHHVKKIFDIYETSEPCIISVTRNADISFDEEKFADDEGDYRLHVSRLLKKRNRLNPVRLEVEGKPEKLLLAGLLKRLKLTKNQMYTYSAPINLGWVFGLERRVDADKRDKLSYAPFVPRASAEFDLGRSIMAQVEERDRLLFFPYDSIDPFLRMLQEAAIDPDVLSIKITVYRLASESRVAQHLAEAAENGKEVTVLMELRARFDEANNIDWSGRLEEAGCNIIYGMENYKCHSKVCLITKRSAGGVTYITQIGTGNYNEKTARLYTDLSLMTSDAEIGRDAVTFFQNMLIGNLNGYYRRLLVAPVAIKRTILKLIDREIAKGPAGRITLKCNSLTERDIIDRLAKASQAGVQVRMNIRGICCMVPGIEGKTENVHVRSIVGQFLEHSRIFVFGEGDDMRMYVGSADLMTRNLVHRVEVAVPITTHRAREAIMLFLDKIFEDNVKARTLEANGEYKMVAESRDKDMCPCDEEFSMQAWCIDHPMQGVKRVASLPLEPKQESKRLLEPEPEPEPEPEFEPEPETEQEVESGLELESEPVLDSEPAFELEPAPLQEDEQPEALEEADIELLSTGAEVEDLPSTPNSEENAEEPTDKKPGKKNKDKEKSGKKEKDKSEKKDRLEKKVEKKSEKKSEKKGKEKVDLDLPFITTKPAHSAGFNASAMLDENVNMDDQPLGKHFKPSKKSAEAPKPVAADVPVSTESTEQRLARERSYMSDFPHTTPKAEETDEAQEHEARHEAQHEAPKKKGWFRSLFS